VKEDHSTVLLGPITSIPCDNQRAQQILRRYGLPSTLAGELLSYFGDTPKYSLLKFANLLIYANFVINQETIDSMELLPDDFREAKTDNHNPVRQVTVADVDIFHNSQAFEKKLYAMVKYGKTSEIDEGFNQIGFSGNTGILASDMLRNYKNLIICSIAMAARAAVEGGLDYETALRQADAFLQKAEMAPDLKHLSSLHHNMLRSFTRQVAARKIGNPESTTAVKIYNYVEQHIHTRIRVQQIADAMGLNRSYLCTQFKKETGMNLHDFISKAKVDQAKLLLTTTNNPSISIASALDFSSQSHFQSTFKKYAGMTPKEYRESNYI